MRRQTRIRVIGFRVFAVRIRPNSVRSRRAFREHIAFFLLLPNLLPIFACIAILAIRLVIVSIAAQSCRNDGPSCRTRRNGGSSDCCTSSGCRRLNRGAGTQMHARVLFEHAVQFVLVDLLAAGVGAEILFAAAAAIAVGRIVCNGRCCARLHRAHGTRFDADNSFARSSGTGPDICRCRRLLNDGCSEEKKKQRLLGLFLNSFHLNVNTYTVGDFFTACP